MTNTGAQASAMEELIKLCVLGADQQEKGCTKKQYAEDGDLTVCSGSEQSTTTSNQEISCFIRDHV